MSSLRQGRREGRSMTRKQIHGQKHARHVAINSVTKKCNKTKFASNNVHSCILQLYYIYNIKNTKFILKLKLVLEGSSLSFFQSKDKL